MEKIEMLSLESSLKKAIYIELNKKGLLNDNDLLELISKLSFQNNCCSQ